MVATVAQKEAWGQRAQVLVAQRFEAPPERRPKPRLAPDHIRVTPSFGPGRHPRQTGSYDPISGP